MNRQIVKLFAFIVVLFALLIGFTSYWSVFDAKALKEEEANKRPLFEQQQIKRGRILADDGTVIARSVPKGHGSDLRYVRRYPQGKLFGHPIGYSFVRTGRLRVRAVPQRTAGRRTNPNSARSSTNCAARNGKATTSSPTSIPPRSESRCSGLEAEGFGAVVAIEPSTGRVRVMASNAPYDPNRVPDELDEAEYDRSRNPPLVNRAHPDRATRRARPSRS